jgi:hypothetical protein
MPHKRRPRSDRRQVGRAGLLAGRGQRPPPKGTRPRGTRPPPPAARYRAGRFGRRASRQSQPVAGVALEATPRPRAAPAALRATDKPGPGPRRIPAGTPRPSASDRAFVPRPADSCVLPRSVRFRRHPTRSTASGARHLASGATYRVPHARRRGCLRARQGSRQCERPRERRVGVQFRTSRCANPHTQCGPATLSCALSPPDGPSAVWPAPCTRPLASLEMQEAPVGMAHTAREPRAMGRRKSP